MIPEISSIGRPALHAILVLILMTVLPAGAYSQDTVVQEPLPQRIISTGWADEASTIGYVAAPTVLGLIFVSGVVNEWNAGYFGIPASFIILAAPPAIFLGGRSVDLSRDIMHPSAKLGWTLYALSIIPTSFALYGYTTDWGATVPLMIASGVLGAGSILAMALYAQSRADTARSMNQDKSSSWRIGVAPLKGGAMAMITYRF